MIEPQERDPLDYIQAKLLTAEQQARDIALDLELNNARLSLLGNDGWKKLQERLKAMLDDETEKLLGNRMDAYQLGARQAFIRALRLLSRERPFSQEELADRRNEGNLLVERIREYRQLLA